MEVKIISEETRKRVDKDYNRFMENPENLKRLNAMLTSTQRVFIDALKEAAYAENDEAEAKDKLLLFKEAMLLFATRPELVPNAPIEVMKQNIVFKKPVDEFEELIILLKVWMHSINRSKRPFNRFASRLAKWSKPPLYVAFVVVLCAAITSALNGLTALVLNQTNEAIKQGIAVIGAGYLTGVLGRAISIKIVSENQR